MIVSVLEIIAAIQKLPPDFAEHVHPSKGGTAEVSSFTDPIQEDPYKVRIKLTAEDTEGLRDVVCSCKAVRLCKHIASFYAVAKNLKPVIGIGDGTEDQREGKQSTDKKIEGVIPHETTTIQAMPLEEGVGGIEEIEEEGKKRAREKRIELYGQISAAFAKLAELEEK